MARLKVTLFDFSPRVKQQIDIDNWYAIIEETQWGFRFEGLKRLTMELNVLFHRACNAISAKRTWTEPTAAPRPSCELQSDAYHVSENMHLVPQQAILSCWHTLSLSECTFVQARMNLTLTNFIC